MNPQHIVYGIFFLLAICISILAIDPMKPESVSIIEEHCEMKDRLGECMAELAFRTNYWQGEPKCWSTHDENGGGGSGGCGVEFGWAHDYESYPQIQPIPDDISIMDYDIRAYSNELTNYELSQTNMFRVDCNELFEYINSSGILMEEIPPYDYCYIGEDHGL